MLLNHSRCVTRRFRLSKANRECYKHSNMTFIPPDHPFDHPILIPTPEVLSKYSTLLFIDNFDFLVCQSVLSALPEQHRLRIEQNKDSFILFYDNFLEELSNDYATPEYPTLDYLTSILEYNQEHHPSGTFILLTEDNIRSVLSGHPDILLENYPLPPGFLSSAFFPEYVKNPELLHRTGQAIRGTLAISHLNSTEGEVLGTGERVRVTGQAINRAMHGDEVYVLDDQVVGIAKQKTRRVVGSVYNIRPLHDGLYVAYVRPIDRRLPDIIAVTSSSTTLSSKVILYLTGWSPTEEFPRGVIFGDVSVRTDGHPPDKMEIEVQAALEHFSIDYRDTPWETILTTPESQPDNPLFSLETAYRGLTDGTRVDLRHLCICSIDPPGCTDIDDALHCHFKDGFIEVGVHIADVSLYVQEGTPLDDAARHRSTTVYLPDRRIDMLPPFLSSQLCSLLPLQDRACISCVWKFNANFEVVDTRIFRSLIKSRAALTYSEAWSLITDSSRSDELVDSLRQLMKIAEYLRDRRFSNGALKLNSTEFNLKKLLNKVDGSGGEPIKADEPDRSFEEPTHYLVEEFMLLANISVAEFLYKNNPEYSLLRRHPLPTAMDFGPINIHVSNDRESSKAINQALAQLTPEQDIIVKRMITRSMQQAVYFVSGESTDFYHYGLASPIYTHFTSPIRRFPDLVVHRSLVRVFTGDESVIDSLAETVTTRACSFMNYRHRNAQNVSRMINELYLYKYLREDPVDATVMAVKEAGCVVFIQEYGLEEYLETGKEHTLFENVRVKIVKDFDKYCIDRKIVLMKV